ncbi:MAG: tetrahydrofolate synthase [Bacteroidetes bacterium]|nr:MAG: tetrahydrofolate synthase [Bacteroidota bacterium]
MSSSMSFQDAIDVLFTKLPMFQRTGPAAYKANLDGTKAVCNMLGNPERSLRFIHIAGTNGKGTVAHMLASVLQTAGYKTGLFTSPHLTDFRERIRLNGEKIPETYVVDFVQQYKSIWGAPSFFELTFGMAIEFFKNEKANIVILETGMGGRLDSTNVIPTAEVCVITNIGLDHTQFLGTDIVSIAKEKAGIIKHQVPIVLGRMKPEAQSTILVHALKMSCETHFGRVLPEFISELVTTPFDSQNLATSSKTIEVMREQGWNITLENELFGLEHYRSITGQTGRWQEIPSTSGYSSVLLDCAHNIDGVSLMLESIERDYPDFTLHIVFGTVGDKDPSSVLSLFPKSSVMYWCSADIPRAMNASTLSALGKKNGLYGRTFESVEEAVLDARGTCKDKKHAKAIVCGSIFIVGDALKSI